MSPLAGSRGRRRLAMGLPLATTLALGACAPTGEQDAPYNPCRLAPELFGRWFCTPDPQNTFAYNGQVSRAVGDLYWLTMWFGTAVTLLVFGLTLYACWRFRRRPEHGVPTQVHGNTRFEVGWTILPTLILVLIGVPSVQVLFELDEPSSPPLEVEVIGHQWWWEFRYPTYNIVTATDLHVPVGQPVRVSVRSADVQHSFWVPRLAGKVDLVPPRVNQMWFNAQEPGLYYGQCAELCGIQHAQMRFYVVADPPADFQRWVQAQQAPAPTPAAGTPQDRGVQALLSGGCIACHTIEGTIARGQVGPNLTHVASRTRLAGGILDNTPENLANWLRNPDEAKVGNLMKLPRPLTEEEVQDLVAYLTTLR